MHALRVSAAGRLRWVLLARLFPLLPLVPLLPVSYAVELPPGVRWTDFTFDRVSAHLAAGRSGADTRLWIGTQGGGVLDFDASTFGFRKHTRVGNCLVEDFVNDIAVDETTGDVWVATDLGLAELPGGQDGEWVVHDVSNSPLTSNLITAVAVDGGDKWIGTFDQGVFLFDGATWTRFSASNSPLSDNFVSSIEVDLDGNKWFGVWGDGVDRFDGEEWVNFDPTNTGTPEGLCAPVDEAPEELGLISFFVRVIGVDPLTGHVWFRCEDDGLCLLNGVTRFDGERWSTFTTANSGLASDQVRSMAGDAEGNAWFATARGASRLGADGVWRTFTAGRDGLSDDNLLSAVSTGEDIWLGGFDGLNRRSSGAFTVFRNDGLPDGNVRDVEPLPPTEGDGAWFATRAGLARLDGDVWEVFASGGSSLPDEDVRALEFDASNTLWIGTRTGGVARFSGIDLEVFDRSNSGIGSNDVSSIAVGPGGEMWFGSEFDGLSRLRGGDEWTHFLASNSGLVANTVQTIAVDSEGSKWIGTGSGLSQFDDEEWISFTTEDGLPSNFVTAVAFGPDGVVWAGTFSAGLARLEGDRWVRIANDDNLASESIRSLSFDDDEGALWIGTWGGGVTRFDGLEWSTWTRTEGLVNDRVLDVEVDHRGRAWIATDLGATVLELVSTEEREFRRGDANCDGGVDISDAIYTFDFLFLGGPPPCCFDAADSSDEGEVTITSAIFTLSFLFTGGAEPPQPGPVTCGLDRTPDALGCAEPAGCPSR